MMPLMKAVDGLRRVLLTVRECRIIRVVEYLMDIRQPINTARVGPILTD